MSGYRLSYTDPNGLTYVLNDDTNATLRVGGLRGFGVLRAEIAKQRVPYQSGVAVLGQPYTPDREMSIALDVFRASYASRIAYVRALRRNLSLYKDADTLGTLIVQDTANNVTRHIRAWMIECPDEERLGPSGAVVVLTFWSPSPWFYDPTLQTVTLAINSAGGITFPVEYVDDSGVEFTNVDIDDVLTFNNAGDVESWPRFVIYGPGQAPALENVTTDKVLSLPDLVLADGDYVIIDMDAATVALYESDGYGSGTLTSINEYLSDDSEFHSLRRGANQYQVSMSNSGSGSIVASWYNYYESGR